MAGSITLERNLLALSTRDPRLSARVAQTAPAAYVRFEPARTGRLVPVIAHGERRKALHSLFDPEREAQRFHRAATHAGCLVFFGLGGGYHLAPFLEDDAVSAALVVDCDTAFLRSVLENLDLRSVLLDPRVSLLFDLSGEELARSLLSSYIPAIGGDLATIPLRARLDTEEQYFAEAAAAVRRTISELADDYTVQAHFGKKWFSNTVCNLEHAAAAATTLRPTRRAIVTGAGPSLDVQIPHLLSHREGATLIATDTSLPALIRRGISPDLVISIDCQHITYHHFLQGFPKDVPLVLDLASPPDVARVAERRVFFTSGHPFSQFVCANLRRFPYIDTSGGNVSHAAVSLADALGAGEILLYGTDFSFPEGKSYARGTYLYRYFSAQARRTEPMESRFFHFLLRNDRIIRDTVDGKLRYTTKPMVSYKERLERASASVRGQLVAAPGLGLALSFPARTRPRDNGVTLVSAGPTRQNWRTFLETYRDQVRALPEPEQPFARTLAQADSAARDVWTTLYPVAAAVRRERVDAPLNAVLAEARAWCLSVIRRRLRYS